MGRREMVTGIWVTAQSRLTTIECLTENELSDFSGL
ncbi:hypothetical protein KRIGEM_03339 [Komagataeibacter rhaeticus]|nr:hypothetical protein KRIGEM_03339 [Komagataeibacter rhaeticus]